MGITAHERFDMENPGVSPSTRNHTIYLGPTASVPSRFSSERMASSLGAGDWRLGSGFLLDAPVEIAASAVEGVRNSRRLDDALQTHVIHGRAFWTKSMVRHVAAQRRLRGRSNH